MGQGCPRGVRRGGCEEGQEERSVVVKLRVLLYCVLGALPQTIGALGTGHFAWWWLAGILLTASFVPVALYGPRGFARQLGVIAPVLLVVTVLCTWSEALIFVRGAGRN